VSRPVKDGWYWEQLDSPLRLAVILSPTPMPPILWPLTISLLRAGYIVLVAVPRVEDAEAMERHLAGLEERSALRVLIYDPEDVSRHAASALAAWIAHSRWITHSLCSCPRRASVLTVQPTTFPPFHRSLLATLTLRFLAPSSGKYAGDPYNPQPAHVPHIHAFVSLYPMNPSPPSQPGALPALPTLLAPNSGSGAAPRLITLYPSSSVLTMPDSFASQVLTTTHHLLGRNLAVMSNAKVVSVYVGDITLPHTHSMLLGGGKQVSRRQQAKEQLQQASTTRKVSIIRDYVWGSFAAVFKTVAYKIGFGSYGRDYACFEQRFLGILKSQHRTQYAVGQYSYLSHFVSRIPVPLLPYALSVLPALPHPTGPLSSGHGLTASRKAAGGKAASAASASSSDHEGGEDLASSIHTTRTTSSRGQPDSESGGSGTGLEGSWVGLDAGN
jgi:hypothetical protein